MAALGRDPVHAEGVAPVSAKMADAQSRDWAARYRRKTGLAPDENAGTKDPLA